MPRISLAEVDESFKNSGEAFDIIDAQTALALDYGEDFYVPFSPDWGDEDPVDDYSWRDDYDSNDYDYSYTEIDFC